MFPKGRLRYLQAYKQECVGFIPFLQDGLFSFKEITLVGTTKACQDISIMHPNGHRFTRFTNSFYINTFTRNKPFLL